MPGVGEPLPHLSECVYLDYNATTPIFPEVAAAMAPYLTDHFGNPSSGHVYGRKCKAAVDLARQRVATLLHAQPDEIYFTACGTESDNWAIYGTVLAARAAWGTNSGRIPHVVCSAIEHPAVLVYLDHMTDQGLLRFSQVACDSVGRVNPDDVVAALTPDTVLVTIMHSNNEVGTIQPIADITRKVRAAAASGLGLTSQDPVVRVHTDAAQSVGKAPVHVEDLGDVDMVTVVGHKFGAPKGIAALYIKKGITLNNFLYGGGQEGGRRAGTENVLLMVGLGAAAEIVTREGQAIANHLALMRDRLKDGLLAVLPKSEVVINGPSDPSWRLPNTLSISIRGLTASHALADLRDSLAASAGAACHSIGHSTMSSVLVAMGMDPAFGQGTLRLSTGRHTTADEVDKAVKLLTDVARAQGVIA